MSESSTESPSVVVTEIDRVLWGSAVFKKSSLNGNNPPLLASLDSIPPPKSSQSSEPRERKGRDDSRPRIKNNMNACFSSPTFWAFVVLAIAGLVAIRYGVEDGSCCTSFYFRGCKSHLSAPFRSRTRLVGGLRQKLCHLGIECFRIR